MELRKSFSEANIYKFYVPGSFCCKKCCIWLVFIFFLVDVKDTLIFFAHPLQHTGMEHPIMPLRLPIHAGKAKITERLQTAKNNINLQTPSIPPSFVSLKGCS